MSLFCLSTSVALVLDYAFTYTVLAPVVFLCVEDEQYRSVAEKKKDAEGLMKVRGRRLSTASSPFSIQNS